MFITDDLLLIFEMKSALRRESSNAGDKPPQVGLE
jgi:hypothetical protein